MHLPDGFGQVAPYLIVEDALPYLDHLCEALGGTVTHRKVFDGVLANAHVNFGQGSVMVTEARPGEAPKTTSATYIFVGNADEVYAKAIAAGMESLFAPADMPYQDRQAGVRDVRGNIWWISQRLVEGPYT